MILAADHSVISIGNLPLGLMRVSGLSLLTSYNEPPVSIATLRDGYAFGDACQQGKTTVFYPRGMGQKRSHPLRKGYYGSVSVIRFKCPPVGRLKG